MGGGMNLENMKRIILKAIKKERRKNETKGRDTIPQAK